MTTETPHFNRVVKDILNGMIYGINQVLPNDIIIGDPTLITKSFYKSGIGVLIGVTGDLKGRLLLEGKLGLFRRIGKNLYDTILEDHLLESFVGELGNMIVGNMVTKIANNDMTVDISPPTVMVGHTKFTCFDQSIHLPIHVEGRDHINLILLFEREFL